MRTLEGYWSLKVRRAVVLAADILNGQTIDTMPTVFVNMGVAIISALLKSHQDVVTSEVLHGVLVNQTPERFQQLVKQIQIEFGSDVLWHVIRHQTAYNPMLWKDAEYALFPELAGYSVEKLFQAVLMGAQAHGLQKRKERNIPFFCHPLNVAIMLAMLRSSQAELIAGLLHDTIEDASLPAETIGNAFGPEVMRLVLACSELDKNMSWEDRKQEAIHKTHIADLSVKLVTCADKLDNLQSISDGLQIYGEQVWQNFRRGRQQQKGYYQDMVRALFDGVPNPPNIFGTLMRLTEKVFGELVINDQDVRAKVPSQH